MTTFREGPRRWRGSPVLTRTPPPASRPLPGKCRGGCNAAPSRPAIFPTRLSNCSTSSRMSRAMTNSCRGWWRCASVRRATRKPLPTSSSGSMLSRNASPAGWSSIRRRAFASIMSKARSNISTMSGRSSARPGRDQCPFRGRFRVQVATVRDPCRCDVRPRAAAHDGGLRTARRGALRHQQIERAKRGLKPHPRTGRLIEEFLVGDDLAPGRHRARRGRRPRFRPASRGFLRRARRCR